ncbi:MAG: hypothetical protein GY811_31405, partial [Myxococcales bacterium]|nr:hypothetical protein [Myxococcales bacterium]
MVLVAACGDGATVGGVRDAGVDASIAFDAAVAADATSPDAAFDAAANTPPAISSILDQTTPFAAIGPISFDISDAETSAASLVVTAISSDQDVLPDSNITLSGTHEQRTISITPLAGGSATLTITVDDGTLSAFSSFQLSVTNNEPLAIADSYATVGNTAFTVLAAEGVLANDSDDDLDDITVIADDIVSSMGGSITLASDGSFSYIPPQGAKDIVDTFDYQLTDGFESSVGTASVTISNLVWYVDNMAIEAGDGRSAVPYQTLPEAQVASGTDDIIFVQGENYSTGIALQEGQILVGAAAGLTVDGVEIIAPSLTRPIITDAAASGVRLSERGEIRGLAIEETGGDGITGSAVTSVLIEDVTIRNTSGQGIDLGNTNPSIPVDITIDQTTIVGDSTLSGMPIGIDIQVAGNGGGNASVAITNTSVSQVPVGIFLKTAGTTGNGAGGPNTLTLIENVISDFDDDGIQIEPDDTASTTITLSDNTLDGVDLIAAATPVRGLDLRIRTTVGGSTRLTMQGNEIRDITDLACANIIGSGSNNGGDFTLLVQNNTFSNCAQEGLLIAPDDELQFAATVDGNTMTDNGAPSTFEFVTGTDHRL